MSAEIECKINYNTHFELNNILGLEKLYILYLNYYILYVCVCACEGTRCRAQARDTFVGKYSEKI